MKLIPYQYNIDDVVRGRDLDNRAFEGPVTALAGPYSVIVCGAFTPHGLIDELVKAAPKPETAGGVFD